MFAVVVAQTVAIEHVDVVGLLKLDGESLEMLPA